MLRQSCNVDIGYIYRYMKLAVLWLYILFAQKYEETIRNLVNYPDDDRDSSRNMSVINNM